MGRPKGSKNKKKGLGDIVEDVTKATGIKKVVGECAGCEARKQMLNNLSDKFRSIFSKGTPLTEERLKEWQEFESRDNKNTITPEQQTLIVTILKENLNMSVKPCYSCGGKILQSWINKINAFIEY